MIQIEDKLTIKINIKDLNLIRSVYTEYKDPSKNKLPQCNKNSIKYHDNMF